MSRDLDNTITGHCGFCLQRMSFPSEKSADLNKLCGDGNFICPNCSKDKRREEEKFAQMEAEKMFNANDDSILREDIPVFVKILALTLLIVFVYILISLIIF